MRILVQNKLVRLCCPIALGLHRHSPLPGPAPASRRGRTHSPPGHGYAQLYLGKDPDNHSTAQRGPGSPTCRASPRSLEQPRPPAPVRGRCDLRASPATALVCRFSLFHSKGSCGHVQLTGPKEFKNKTTRQRVKLMQVFSFCFFICFSFASVLEKRGVQGLAEKRRMYRASPAEAVAQARAMEGAQARLAPASGPESDVGDVSPLKKALPSCDPALAWESAQGRP